MAIGPSGSATPPMPRPTAGDAVLAAGRIAGIAALPAPATARHTRNISLRLRPLSRVCGRLSHRNQFHLTDFIILFRAGIPNATHPASPACDARAMRAAVVREQQGALHWRAVRFHGVWEGT